jgi:hypothetical protein
MTDRITRARLDHMPPVEWDGRVSVPTRYGEDEFGTMRIPAHEWVGRDRRIWWCQGQTYHWSSTLELMEPWNAPVERQWDGTCVKPGSGYPRVPPKPATVVGSFGWTLVWAFFLGVPTFILSAALVGAVPPPPNGTTHAQDHAAVAICVAFWVTVWVGVHQFRVARGG